MEKKKIIMIAVWVLTFVWMGIIFYLSNQPAVQSSHLSSGITKRFVNIIENFVPAINNLEFESLETCIRKNAHFIAYLVLGVLALVSLKLSNIKKAALLALFICVSYAISDEFHQLFVFGRSCQFSDVLIDTAGALLGILLAITVVRILARRF
ncbi:MAG: VanZ family protein [Acetobacterium woodii]|nr:VanZ family protein [Acetobacterium woodii]